MPRNECAYDTSLIASFSHALPQHIGKRARETEKGKKIVNEKDSYAKKRLQDTEETTVLVAQLANDCEKVAMNDKILSTQC